MYSLLLVFFIAGLVGVRGGVVPYKGGSSRLGIYHGETADVTDYPYVASVTYMGVAHCTGVIISSSWVLTTADCIDNYDAYYTTVMAGANEASSGSQEIDVWANYVHSKYDSSTGDYNFGLLQMDGTFDWTDSVGNISLPSARVDAATWLTVVGYGDTDENDNDLIEGKMAVVKNEKCEKLYKKKISLTKRMGCVYNEGKTSVCEGDFGAPLVKDGVLYYLAASVASKGECSSKAYPVVTADVYSVIKWINDLIGSQ